jgi:Spy/CpxP family protein refolding chaperone
MIRTLAQTLFVLAVVAGAPGEVWAQRGSSPGNTLTRPEMVRRIQAQFQDQIARSLQLTPEERAVLEEVLEDYAASRAEILPRRTSLDRQIREVLQQEGPDERARALILEVRALRERELQLMAEEEDRLLEVLEPSQVLLLQFLRDQFGTRIRVLRQPEGPITFGPRGSGPPTP